MAAEDPKDILTRYPTREAKIARIRVVEKKLSKMESDDDENDPVLIKGHIKLTRGFRMGCGVFFLLIMVMGLKIYFTGHAWGMVMAVIFAIIGIVLFLRGLLYLPDPKLIEEAYQPHRGTEEYRALVAEMDILARAISQDLQAEDA